MRRYFQASLIMTAILFAASLEISAAPKTIRVQGRLTDNKGAPLPAGKPSVYFEIFEEGANQSTWTTGKYIEVETNSAGLFSTELGPIPSEIFKSGKDLFLEISIEAVGKRQTLSPRQKLTSVPSAVYSEVSHQADFAKSVNDGSIGTNQLQDKAVTREKIADETIESLQIKDGQVMNGDLAPAAVSSDKILDGTIQSVDIASNGVNDSNIPLGAISGNRISSGTVTDKEIGEGQVTSRDIRDNTITEFDIGYQEVNSWHIKDNTIAENDIGYQQVNTWHMKDGSIDPSDMNFAAFAAVPSGYAFVPPGIIVMSFTRCPVGYRQLGKFNNRFPLGADVGDDDPDIPNRTGKDTSWGVGNKTDNEGKGFTVIFCQKR